MRDARVLADFVEEFVDVWQVVQGHVFDEGVHQLIVADFAVNPADEEASLDKHTGQRGDLNDGRVQVRLLATAQN